MQQLGFVNNQTVFHYVDQGGQHSEHYWCARRVMRVGERGALVHLPMLTTSTAAPSSSLSRSSGVFFFIGVLAFGCR